MEAKIKSGAVWSIHDQMKIVWRAYTILTAEVVSIHTSVETQQALDIDPVLDQLSGDQDDNVPAIIYILSGPKPHSAVTKTKKLSSF